MSTEEDMACRSARVQADWLLLRLARRTEGDAILSMAALALALCSLARADGQPLEEILKLINLVHADLEELDGYHRPTH